MPELAEVEYYRKQWDVGLGCRIINVIMHPEARVFRGMNVMALQSGLKRSTLKNSHAHGKQMLFEFSGGKWLGVHLGMSGRTLTQPKDFIPDRHDHLVLFTSTNALVYTDPRLFGRIRYDTGKQHPDWWLRLPPDLLSDEFTPEVLKRFLQRRGNAPIKAVLLMQERFPGIGNWMADEILWRARIRPSTLAGQIHRQRLTRLYDKIREVCCDALKVIGGNNSDPPDTWLFNHRWRDNGNCPQTGVALKREEIGGRTTCWSPKWQR